MIKHSLHYMQSSLGWLPLFPKSLKNREKHVASNTGKSCLRSTKKIKENESLSNSLGNTSNILKASSGQVLCYYMQRPGVNSAL